MKYVCKAISISKSISRRDCVRCEIELNERESAREQNDMQRHSHCHFRWWNGWNQSTCDLLFWWITRISNSTKSAVLVIVATLFPTRDVSIHQTIESNIEQQSFGELDTAVDFQYKNWLASIFILHAKKCFFFSFTELRYETLKAWDLFNNRE